MATCPAGHDSAATDFCDVCGMRMGEAAPGASAGGPIATATPPDPGAGEAAEQCPNCGADRTGQFCEACGFDFSTGTATPAGAAAAGEAGQAAGTAAPAGPAWTAVVTADRDYFDSVVAAGGPDAATIQFPAYCPERRFRLTGGEMRIGRRSASRGLEPEIDLTGPPADTGISHLHAVLTAGPDGGWSVMDPGSSNGTQVNGNEIAVGVPVPLHDADRIGLGGWTVVRIQVS
jgi:hypothetical protein